MKDLTPDRFRKLLADEGFQVLSATETGDTHGRAWTEWGRIDETGHEQGVGLARLVPGLILGLAQRVAELLEAGWGVVHIVTDHGWLLMPGGLPRSDLPKFLTETRWRRCAVLKESATVELPCHGWYWNDAVRVASPAGIGCFVAGETYHHGGVSPQECVVPQITVRSAAPRITARIEQVRWSGLRCRVKIGGQHAGCRVGLRDRVNDGESSIAEPRAVASDGSVSLVVPDDRHAEKASNLVVLDEAGNVVDKQAVTVGG